MKKQVVFVTLLVCALCLSVVAQVNNDVYSQLKYRYIGPVGNRADAVAGVPGNPNIYYVGAASGGIFKSTDGGIHWDPIFDSEAVSSIGSLAVAPSDPNIVWAGTGEAFIRSHISIGQGIYKSTDAGKTWKLMGLEKTGRIGNVIVDPRNPDIVFACSLGTAYGPQQERGVYRTADGGKTWERTLFVDENTGCSDLGMDPSNPHILFAGMWQVEIRTWGRTSGGPGSGLFRSADGGLTWKRLEGHGLPAPPVGRIAVRIAQKDSHRVYTMIETGDGVPIDGKPTQRGQLWRSDDGGENWTMVNADRNIRGRTHYYTRMEIAPDDENEAYFFSAAFSHTLDGGRSLTPLAQAPGGDNHEMWIDPTNGDRMAVVNDGGVAISVNRGKSWNRIQLPIAQIYHATVDSAVPYFVYGNKQDGSSYRGPSNTGGGGFGGGGFGGGISRSEWHPVAGGESGFATPDPTDPNTIWTSGTGSGSVSGAVMIFDERNHQSRDVEVWPENVSGATAAEVKYRFNWEFPITISPNDHNRVYVGSQYVHVTTDRGNSWQVISPDLTRNDKSKMGSSGGLTPDNIGVEYAGVVFAIAESPKDANTIWAGTNDGLLQITRDGGKNWTNVTKNITGLPEWGTVSNIEASRFDAGTAYVTVDFHQMNNRDPYVYKTNDFGKTWTLITNGIPHSMLSYAHCVREDPARKGLLYLGTENALYVSFDDGAHWQSMQANLPHAPVYWITVQERFHDLVLSTYGRGFWVMDDISPLEQLTPQVQSANAHLFEPREAWRFRSTVGPASVSYDPTAGQNPPYGAAINFYLKSALGERDRARITISDAAGNVVRTINCSAPRGEGAPVAGGGRRGGGGGGGGFGGGEEGPRCDAKPGINRFVWDLRGEPSAQVRLRTTPLYAPDVTVNQDGTRPAPGLGRVSILEPPGTYTVKLTVGGQDYTQKLEVRKDPRSTGTEQDIATQTKLLTEIRGLMNDVADTVNQVEQVRAQINNFQGVMLAEASQRTLRTAAEELGNKLSASENKVIQLKNTGHGQDDVRWSPMLLEKLEYLAQQVGSSDFPPTTQQVAVFEELKKQAAGSQDEIAGLLSKDVQAFNASLKEQNIPNIVVGQRQRARAVSAGQ